MYFFFGDKKSDRKIWVDKTIDEVIKNRITIIQGLRRIGKSLIMETVATNGRFDEYEKIPFDAKDFGINNIERGKEIIKKVESNINSKYLIMIDEFQEINEWNKLFWTLHKYSNIKIIATGSVSANMGNAQETEGGRYVYVFVTPLSYLEYTQINKDDLIKNDVNIVFNKYATMGSYPGQEFSENFIAYKKQITGNILEKIKNARDLKLMGIDDNQAVTQVLLFIIENIGNTISISNLSKNIGKNVRTIEKIINFLKNTFIIYEINNANTGKGKAAMYNRKFYLADHTFYLYQSQREFDQLDDSYKGFVFENIIFNQLKAHYERSEIDLRFHLNKTGSQHEDIDMVVTKNDVSSYFEIKTSKNTNCLTNGQKIFSKKKQLNVIYFGPSQKIDNIRYINYIEFIEEVEKWI